MADRKVARRTPARVVKAQPALRHLKTLPPLRIAAQAGQTIASMLPVIGGDVDVWGDKLNQLVGSAVYIVSGVTPDAYGNVDLSGVFDAMGAAATAKAQAISAAASDATTKAASALSTAKAYTDALGSSLPAIYDPLGAAAARVPLPANSTPGFVATVGSDGNSVVYSAAAAGAFDGGMDY